MLLFLPEGMVTAVVVVLLHALWKDGDNEI